MTTGYRGYQYIGRIPNVLFQWTKERTACLKRGISDFTAVKSDPIEGYSPSGSRAIKEEGRR